MGISSVSWPKPFPPRPKRDWNLPKRWRGLTVSDVRTSPTPYVQDALAQPSKKILAPSYRENTLVSKQLPCQAEIEDQRGTEAQKTPCGATPNKSAGAANDLNSFRRTWHPGNSVLQTKKRHTPVTCQAGIESQRNEVPLPKGRHRKSAEQPIISIPFLETWHPTTGCNKATRLSTQALPVPGYFIINNSKIALFYYVSIFRFALFWQV